MRFLRQPSTRTLRSPMLICDACGTVEYDADQRFCHARPDKKAPRKQCGGALRQVACLMCLEQGEVEVLGEMRPCPRGCKKRS